LTTPPPTKNYTLSLHDALPISVDAVYEKRVAVTPGREPHRSRPDALRRLHRRARRVPIVEVSDERNRRRLRCDEHELQEIRPVGDRKSTRLNSSHVSISYAVFC